MGKTCVLFVKTVEGNKEEGYILRETDLFSNQSEVDLTDVPVGSSNSWQIEQIKFCCNQEGII